MPGPILHIGAVVTCAHGGQAQPTVPSPQVSVMGMPIATIAVPYAVAGCAFLTPCVTGQWMVGAVRVTSMGVPVAILTGVGITVPNGTPLLPISAQTRVIAT